MIAFKIYLVFKKKINHIINSVGIVPEQTACESQVGEREEKRWMNSKRTGTERKIEKDDGNRYTSLQTLHL